MMKKHSPIPTVILRNFDEDRYLASALQEKCQPLV